MKKLLAILFLLLSSQLAHAGVPCSVPFNLTNGTTADATQVMANYNAILNCLANGAAASGTNSDISSLTGLTTPLAPGEGGTTIFAGGTATMTSNALVIPSTTPNSFILQRGYCVTFFASASNTGATTLNTNSTGVVNVFKPSQTGPTALLGGEIVGSQLGLACYDGTQYQLNPNSQSATLNTPNQVVSGGATVNASVNGNLGNINTPGTSITANCGLSPLQYFTNNANLNFLSPANDGSCLFLVTNGATPGTFTAGSVQGWTFGANTGDPYDGTSGHRFIFSVVRINSISTYVIKALQ